MKKIFIKTHNSSLVRNTCWMFAGNGFRLIIQAVYFILVARSLGPKDYGVFAAAVAMVGIVSPFVGIGCGNLLVKHVARDVSEMQTAWGNGLFITSVTGILAIFVLNISASIMKASIPLTLLFIVSISELLFYKLIELSTYAYRAVEMMGRCAQINLLVSTMRLVGIALLINIVSHPTAIDWGCVYLCATIIVALISFIMMRRSFGAQAYELHKILDEFLEGLYFSCSVSATSIYNDIDKTMLVVSGSLAATGIYAAAYRLIDVSFVPVSSMLAAAYSRFFQKGVNSATVTVAFAKRLLMWSYTYTVVACIALVVCAPLIPKILGDGYSNSVEALRWLALLPVMKASHYLFADALTGAGYQGVRTLVQIIIAVFNVLINLWLIPKYSWRGAAWSSLISDGLLALLMWAAATIISGRDNQKYPRALSCKELA